MTAVRHFGSYTDARNQLRAVLDAAHDGLVTTVDRDDQRFVVVSADLLRSELAALRPANATAVAEGGGWAVVVPGLPVHGDGDTFEEAVTDVIEALREYAADWNLRLRLAANHAQHRAVVELVELSSDAQLRAWLVGDRPEPTASTQLGASSAASR